MKEDVLKIINNYGVLHQLKYFQSEVFELNEAIIQAEEFKKLNDRYNIFNKNHIAEEIADVMVMLEQFKNYYGISSEEITRIFWGKVYRQLDRIEKEKEDK